MAGMREGMELPDSVVVGVSYRLIC